MKRKKVLFIIPSMRGGGAEKVISIILKKIDKKKFEPILVLLEKKGKFLEELPPIKIIDLKTPRARYALFQIIRVIYLEKPEIVFTTLGHLNLIIALIRPLFSKSIKFIARESNTVSVQNQTEKYPIIFNFLYRNIYNNFDKIICQSEYMKNDLIINYKIKKNKIVVINNPVDIDDIEKKSNDFKPECYNNNMINLVAIGRLVYQKGFDLLIKAFAKLDKKYTLTILGNGPLRNELERLAQNYSINERIKLVGFQKNPYPYMKNADFLVLSSRYEGFPNVVLEANCCGIPVIAFNCPGGTNEIIKNELNGFLCSCSDIEDLTFNIQKAVNYKFNASLIKEYIKINYNTNYIVQLYEKEME
ncbi:glycosyltransferase [Hydrogenimonas urashimensis]|uniref:glycosyltransferase n=1 Tax=Hydrogenimonas urashimensis TaxID=2740515 RepID=UPI0019150F03|nr:glycosyltransferase [Hydrogenimonas urashimensis]